MKTKFDDNVAHDIPVTRETAEPELPWKISESEMTRIGASDEDLKAAVAAAPLQVRAVFIALLVITIFVVVLNSIVNTAIDNNEMQLDVIKKGREVSVAQAELARAAADRAAMSEDAAKMEKRISDLNFQKELYSAVIETLTKKTDDTQLN